ncbi:YcjX family protein [Alteromonas sp. ASW11-19]|uniref:YcjX family protein n=1 Tax=Alteromonas salexigens TaxID=2982530 RepID=A0ABT2VN87_9ALTE|nr:YcjX family protein [Alteromonas salexigens]MCU7554776.1 YcjX family protein [Alteromonas salexigens]
MRDWLKQMMQPVQQVSSQGMSQVDAWFLQERHRFTITGLSRSGKSMLFTSLMTILKYRSEEKYNCLPLLESLPMELVDHMRIEPLPGYAMFPADAHLQALESGHWPAPTEQAYGFKLIVRLRQTGNIKKLLMPYTDVVFEFIDYPGEWITDMPMLGKSFSQWSDSAWAQQASEPQKHYSSAWHAFVEGFDFEQPPTREAVLEVVSEYRRYLQHAKAHGISMLQPGSFLIDGSGFDWRAEGFAPLPAKITSDISHPWYKAFAQHYAAFQDNWLTPLKESTFRETDKQIILVDLFEGLNHSRQHLYQLKETLSHLAETFVYGNPGWFARNVLRQRQIGRVAFVATKTDLIPESQKPALLSLLQQITEGAVAKFADKPIQFEHFLVSAMQTTDSGEHDNALRYTNPAGAYVEANFEPLPSTLKDMESDAHYPVLQAQVPKDHLPRMLNGRGLDRLFEFLLNQEA